MASPLVLVYNITVSGFELVLPLSGGTITSVDWGDGNTTTDGSRNHTYTNSGTYTVSVNGTGVTDFNYETTGTGVQYLTACTSFGEIGLTNLYSAFRNATQLTAVPASLPSTSNVTNMSFMFQLASAFNQDISSWDVSKVTNMRNMFSSAIAFNQDISNWNVSNVTNMTYMFSSASSFNQPIGSWDVSNVTDMSIMFCNASSFNQDISNWNVSAVERMSNMFQAATMFNQPIGNWNVSNLRYAGFMFNNANAFNQDISNWNFSNIVDLTSMFENATAFSKLGPPFILDNILNTWSALTVQSGVTLDAPLAYYSITGQAGYDALVVKGWTINAQLYVPSICFLEGSKILCSVDGQETYVPIETIRKGTLVKTRLNGYIPVDMIGHSKIYNPGHSLHSKNRLYKLSLNQYPELTEDLFITGCHSILVGKLTVEQREKSIEFTGDVYVTENRYRLIACLDDKAEPFTEEGIHTIWHLALENQDNYMNYGCYANGLLVETTSKRMMSELSGMELV
jgi:surface protein